MRRSLRVRLRAYWVVAVIVLAAAAYGGYRAVRWPGFALKSVVVSGARVTPNAAVLRAAALPAGANIWLLNLRGARSRIETLPYVRTATLVRRPPGTIIVNVAERTPDGCLIGNDGAAALIDGDARVLEWGCGMKPVRRYRVRLPVPAPGAFVHDEGVARLQDDAHALARDGHVYAALAHDRFGDLDATLPNGVVVLFGAEGDIQQKARLVDPILQKTAARSGALAAIDLRAPGTPIVRYR